MDNKWTVDDYKNIQFNKLSSVSVKVSISINTYIVRYQHFRIRPTVQQKIHTYVYIISQYSNNNNHAQHEVRIKINNCSN